MTTSSRTLAKHSHLGAGYSRERQEAHRRSSRTMSNGQGYVQRWRGQPRVVCTVRDILVRGVRLLTLDARTGNIA